MIYSASNVSFARRRKKETNGTILEDVPDIMEVDARAGYMRGRGMRYIRVDNE